MEKKSLIFSIVIMVLLMFSLMKSCSLSRKLDANKKELVRIDSLVSNLPSQFKNTLQIEGYRISKRLLYDNNAIIRTTVRPDDQMNQYDIEIQKLLQP